MGVRRGTPGLAGWLLVVAAGLACARREQRSALELDAGASVRAASTGSAGILPSESPQPEQPAFAVAAAPRYERAGVAAGGLGLGPGGTVTDGGAAIPSVPAGVQAAALYRRSQRLVIVEGNGRTTLFSLESGTPRELQRMSPEGETELREVLWSRLPGLLYLTLTDLALERKIRARPAAQLYSDRYRRIALQDGVAQWHAVPSSPDDGAVLGALYRELNGEVVLDQGARRLHFRVPHPLEEPFRSGPGDPLAQAVFLFGDQGLACKTRGGWSFHWPDGRLRWTLPDPPLVEWWEDPQLSDGRLELRARTGPEGFSVLVDVETGVVAPQQLGGAAPLATPTR